MTDWLDDFEQKLRWASRLTPAQEARVAAKWAADEKKKKAAARPVDPTCDSCGGTDVVTENGRSSGLCPPCYHDETGDAPTCEVDGVVYVIVA